jgi:hypothetical protein
MRTDGLDSKDRTGDILTKYLDEDFIVFPMAENISDPGELRALGEFLGVSYPEEFIAHACGEFPGIYVEAKEEVWPRGELYDVGPFWSFLYGLHTFSASASSEPWMRLATAAESFQADSGHRAAPILRIVGDADVYCVDSTGDILRYNFEENLVQPVNHDFWTIFEKELAALVKRKNRKKNLE